MGLFIWSVDNLTSYTVEKIDVLLANRFSISIQIIEKNINVNVKD